MALGQYLDQNLPKMMVINIASNESVSVQFNPTEFQTKIRAVWVKQIMPGLSHEPLQFSHTENQSFSFELFYRASTIEEQATLMRVQNFFQALCIPTSRLGGGTGAPPRAIFVWPNYVSMQVVLEEVTLNPEMFDSTGQPIHLTIAVQLQEIREVRMLSSEIRDIGMQRSQVAAEFELGD